MIIENVEKMIEKLKLWGRIMNLDYLLKISFGVHGLIQLEDILYPQLIYFFPKVYN